MASISVSTTSKKGEEPGLSITRTKDLAKTDTWKRCKKMHEEMFAAGPMGGGATEGEVLEVDADVEEHSRQGSVRRESGYSAQDIAALFAS
eukprot:m.96958 g.96958  ORF g.96958 m.96958 type:complete len:91 (+) comp13087_c0_seq1:301-573(+)